MIEIECDYPGCDTVGVRKDSTLCEDCHEAIELVATHEEAIATGELSKAFEIFCAECNNTRPYVEGVPQGAEYDEICPSCASENVDLRELQACGFYESVERQIEAVEA